jgi:PPK2 family polyphosphate:nucleotide phosphotransferase
MLTDQTLADLRVEPGKKARLHKRDTDWVSAEPLREADEARMKAEAAELLDRNKTELAAAQDVLYAAGTHAVLIVLQAMDAAGKDGIVKHVLSGVNPQGCQVWPFKVPTPEEKAHDFLWRAAARLPPRGTLGIFNRSYYEDVLVVRVHPELLGPDRPKKLGKVWKARYAAINAFERHLTRERTTVLKFYLHVSKAEQKKRLLARVDDPTKHWKFQADDLKERARWDDYREAYEDALTATSTRWAPWYVVPADHKWVARAVVAEVVTRAIRGLDLRYPTLPADEEAALADARRELERE